MKIKRVIYWVSIFLLSSAIIILLITALNPSHWDYPDRPWEMVQGTDILGCSYFNANMAQNSGAQGCEWVLYLAIISMVGAMITEDW
jgi:hypothetical protein